jgi:phage major head subunit gpT-like protein
VIWKPGNLIVNGVKNSFFDAMNAVPNLWVDFCQLIPATTKTETLAWPGTIPRPRLFIDGRQLQSITDFKYIISNETYELSFLINREYIDDDQTGLIMANVQEIGARYAAEKNIRFAALLESGGTATWGVDGVAFFTDARTIGDSAPIDNNTTSNITDPANPTASDIKAALIDMKAKMLSYQDDQGVVGYNAAAITMLHVIVPPYYEMPFREVLNASFISQTDNVFQGFAKLTVNPYLTSTDKFYLTANGATKKGMIYMSRTPLEIVMHDSMESYALNYGLHVTSNERDVMAYGDPRRIIRHTFT